MRRILTEYETPQALLWCLNLILVNGLLSAAQPEVKNVMYGESVTFLNGISKADSYTVIGWVFNPEVEKTKIAQLSNGLAKANYDERFRGRLQLDEQTGSLTIRNLTTRDSGVYRLQIFGESDQNFNLTVYAAVATPHVSKKTPTTLDGNYTKSTETLSVVSGSSSDVCSVLCSVENGREVTLSWYKGNEALNQTSSPDLSTSLSLPLEIEDQDRDTYSCVAANPVSNQTTQLNVKQLCSQVDSGSQGLSPLIILTAGLISLSLLVIIGIFVIYTKRKVKMHEAHSVGEELHYADVNFGARRLQTRDTDGTEDTVYSTVIMTNYS